MFIEVTKISGEPVTINVLQIETVEGPKVEGTNPSLLNQPQSVLVKVNKAGYYVKESYHEIIEKMKNAMHSITPLALMK